MKTYVDGHFTAASMKKMAVQMGEKAVGSINHPIKTRVPIGCPAAKKQIRVLTH